MRVPWVALFLLGCYPDFVFGGGAGGSGGAGNGGDSNTSSSRAGNTTTTGPQTIGGGNEGGAPMHTTNGPGGGGAAGDGGGSPAGVGGAGGGPPTPMTVPCGDGNSVLVDCDLQEVCCFSLDSASMDHCEATSDCGFDYYTFLCNGQDDCATGTCCAIFDDLFEDFTGVIDCQSSCDAPSYVVCTDVSDCQSGETCTQLFTDTFAPEYAPDYKVCAGS